jgi:transcriptional regulator with XRE-family HTH domain
MLPTIMSGGARGNMRKKRPQAIDVLVGSNIRIRRLERQVSQTKLAQAIGVTFQQVQKYEKGTNRVGASRLTRIANMLEVPVAQFFIGAQGNDWSEQDLDDSPVKLLAEPYALRLAQAFVGIKDLDLRRSLVDVVEIIASTKSGRAR